MPWSIFDYGKDVVLQDVIDGCDAEARAAIEADRDILLASATDHGLPTWPWKGDDDVPWSSRVTILGGRVLVRYAIVPGHPTPAIIAAADFGDDQ